MALTITELGAFGTAANALTLTGTITSSVSVNDFLVCCIAMDNQGASGVGVTSLAVSDTKGNQWFNIVNNYSDPGSASAGAYGAIFVALCTTAMTTSDTITATTTTTNAAIAMSVYKVNAGSGKLVYMGTNGSTAGTTSATKSITTGSLISGEAVIGMTAMEHTQAITADSDTTNGSWSTAQTQVSSGSTTAAMRVSSQYKVVTGAGTQTYDTSWSTTNSVDFVIAYITFTEGDPLLPGVQIPFHSAMWGGDPNQTAPSNGAAVSAWNNGGYHTVDWAQGNGSLQPTYNSSDSNLNGKPTLVCTPTSSVCDSLRITNLGGTITGATSLIGAFYLDPTNNGQNFGDFLSTYQRAISYDTDNSFNIRMYAGTNVKVIASDVRGTARYVCGVFNGASSKFQDGATTTTGLSTGGNSTSQFNLGDWDGNGNSGANVHFGFAALYLGDITAHPNYNDLQTWITTEYNLTTGVVVNTTQAYWGINARVS